MKRIVGICALLLTACASLEYGRMLDQCALDHRHDPQGRADCQCAVALDAGRSCDKFRVDSGSQDAAPEAAPDAGSDAADTGAE